MRKTIKALSLLMAVVLVFSFAACGKKTNVAAPSYETQKFEDDACSFDYPKEWKQYDDPTGGDVLLFAPSDADLNAGSSNINLVFQSGSEVPKLSVLMAQLKAGYETQIKSIITDATNFTFEDTKINGVDCAIVSYESAGAAGVKMFQKQYMLLYKDSMVSITATDIGSSKISPDEIAVQIANTLKLK